MASLQNLTDAQLASYWRVKTLINIAHATRSRDEAELWRPQRGQIYIDCKLRIRDRKTKPLDDEEGMKDLHAFLDELKKCQTEDRAKGIGCYGSSLAKDDFERGTLPMQRILLWARKRRERLLIRMPRRRSFAS
jgi:hypothetical protein